MDKYRYAQLFLANFKRGRWCFLKCT